MEEYEKLKQLLADTEVEAKKFFEKKVKASGPRLRAAMQDIKTLANEVRAKVLEVTKAGKDSK